MPKDTEELLLRITMFYVQTLPSEPSIFLDDIIDIMEDFHAFSSGRAILRSSQSLYGAHHVGTVTATGEMVGLGGMAVDIASSTNEFRRMQKRLGETIDRQSPSPTISPVAVTVPTGYEPGQLDRLLDLFHQTPHPRNDSDGVHPRKHRWGL